MTEDPAGTSLDVLCASDALRLADGVELFGQYKDSGYADAPYLIRRADGRMVAVSCLLYEVAAALDGARSLRDIASIVSARVGRTLTAENVAFLIDEKLRPLRLIAGPAGCSPRSRPVSPALTLSVRRAVIPKGAVNALTTLFLPLFLPPVVIATLVGLGAVDVWLLLTGGMDRSLQQVAQRPELVLLVAALTLFGAGFHELGHATATRYGGAEPGVIGVGVYLLWPVFYNDLNDSYRLSRRNRLRADLGGVYFNAFFILLLTGAYAVSDFEPLLAVVAVQHLAIVQQFLPFVRLDGYYVVSDIAGVPDLFGSGRGILSSLVLGRKSAPGLGRLRLGPRRLVKAWVLVTVPVVVACLVWLVVRLPRLLTLAGTTALVHGRELVTAWRHGAAEAAAVSALQLVLLAVPVIGLSAVAFNVVSTCCRSFGGHRASRRRARARQSVTPPIAIETSRLREGAASSQSGTTSSWLVALDDLDPSDCWVRRESTSSEEDRADELDPADLWSAFDATFESGARRFTGGCDLR